MRVKMEKKKHFFISIINLLILKKAFNQLKLCTTSSLRACVHYNQTVPIMSFPLLKDNRFWFDAPPYYNVNNEQHD